MKSFCSRINTPIGVLYGVATETALTHLFFKNEWQQYRNQNPHLINKFNPILTQVKIELAEYFQGKRNHFEIPIQLEGTPFQVQAWKSLLKIPFGKTISYSEQAALIKNSGAVRAVGSANGKNPICIIIPCHRVTAKGSKLGGYSGGLEIKKKLLELEGLSFS